MADYYSREDYNREQTAPRAAVLGASAVLQRGAPDVQLEQSRDLQLQSLGRRPASYAIAPEAPEETRRLRAAYEAEAAAARATLPRRHPGLPEIRDPVKRFVDELPENGGRAAGASHRGLRAERRRRDAELLRVPERDVAAEMRRDHVVFERDDAVRFTRTGLLERRRDEQRRANEAAQAAFVERARPRFQDAPEVPFYEVDGQFSYARAPPAQASQRALRLQRAGRREAPLDKVGAAAAPASLRTLARAREARQEAARALLDPRACEAARPAHGRRAGFTAEILADRNPEWALLRVKGAMDGAEDRPLYSCFSPDGYFREQMLPQVRAQRDAAGAVPRELRGLVRVMQLPVAAAPPPLLGCDEARLPGATRVAARPDFFE